MPVSWPRAALLVAALALAAPLGAQTPPAKPETPPAGAPASAAPAPRPEEPPKNLQVLPKELTRRQVIDIMRGFTAALDVQCTHCHAAKDPADFSTVDFASDEKEEKRTARVMIGMVKTINAEYVSKVAMPGSPEVRCITCHRGQARPRTIEDVLAHPLAEGGARPALEKYQELREKYYGRGGYDFGPDPLAMIGQRLAREQKHADALAILEFNAKQHPDSTRTLAILADVQVATGNRAAAIATLMRVLTLEPDDERTKRRLDELTRPEPK